MLWRNTLPKGSGAVFAIIGLAGQLDRNVPTRKIPKLAERRKAGGANTGNGFDSLQQIGSSEFETKIVELSVAVTAEFGFDGQQEHVAAIEPGIHHK